MGAQSTATDCSQFMILKKCLKLLMGWSSVGISKIQVLIQIVQLKFDHLTGSIS